MATYFISIFVSPLEDNPLRDKVEEARVFFWIVEQSPEEAMQRASEYLVKYRWEEKSIEKSAFEVQAADFAGQEEALLGFWKAKQKGFAAQFLAKPKSNSSNPLTH
ncbi:MAG TPA: hypothetical protein VHO84_01750 [Syntrophorhabdaceae bacterium]|nr:hypothetical protein [Syntrophorhabdaceae bacterium]